MQHSESETLRPEPPNLLRTMCDNAFDWARGRGLVYRNPIHGAEEADIPYKTFWKNKNESGSRAGFESGFSLDVP